MAKKAAKKTVAKVAHKPAAKSTAVAPYTPPPLPANATPLQSTLHAVVAATRDQTIDVEKLERLLAVQERLIAADAKREFDYQMAEMQPGLPVVKKSGTITITDKNDKTKIIQQTPYAKFEDIQKLITPYIARFGFAITYRTGRSADGLVTVTGVLSHRQGHREETTITLQTDATGSKNNVQGVGSSISYGKRYIISALLNLTFEGMDDDGQAGGGTPEPTTIDKAQERKLQEAMAKGGHPLQRVLSYVNTSARLNPPITMLTEIPTAWFERTLKAMGG